MEEALVRTQQWRSLLFQVELPPKLFLLLVNFPSPRSAEETGMEPSGIINLSTSKLRPTNDQANCTLEVLTEHRYLILVVVILLQHGLTQFTLTNIKGVCVEL